MGESTNVKLGFAGFAMSADLPLDALLAKILERNEPGDTVDELLRWLARTGYRNADLGRARALRIIANKGTIADVRTHAEKAAEHLPHRSGPNQATTSSRPDTDD